MGKLLSSFVTELKLSCQEPVLLVVVKGSLHTIEKTVPVSRRAVTNLEHE